MSDNQRISLKNEFQKIRENIYFILVEPEAQGNLGATARALKTTGFKNLILINPKINHTMPEVYWMAHQSEDILNNVISYANLDEAISGMNLVIGTTQRKRHFKFPLFTPEEIAERISSIAVNRPVAIIFGRERTGLTNEELIKCHIHSTIPTATRKPSLNLAQAVMIYCYTFFIKLNAISQFYTYQLASTQELESLYTHLFSSITELGFVPRDSMDNFITRFKRLIGRSMAEKRDIRLLHKLLQIYEKRIAFLNEQLKDQKNQTIC
jgi:tRNA (cytidine32/uridine32-2'-O)-methyltransferase